MEYIGLHECVLGGKWSEWGISREVLLLIIALLLIVLRAFLGGWQHINSGW